MSDFDPAFLVRALRITEEHAGTPNPIFIELNGERISKLASAVGQDHREELRKHLVTEDAIEIINDCFNRLGSVVVTDKSEHQGAIS